MSSKRLRRGLLAAVILLSVVGFASAQSGQAPAAGQSQGSTPAAPHPAGAASRQMFVEDGQLMSHPFIVFVTHPITEEMDPVLTFLGMHLVTKASSMEIEPLKPVRVLPGQYRTVEIAGQPVTVPGTLLIFDLSRHRVPFFKAAVRFIPSLSWTASRAEAGRPAKMDAISGEDEIYIGSMPGAVLWTSVTIFVILGLLFRWTALKARAVTRFPARPVLFLVTGPDGYLSLWRTQLLCWTIAVGSVVFLFGLMRLRVPDIPETLVALMGMSVLTGTLSALRASSGPKANPAVVAPPPVVPPAAAGVARPAVTFNPGRASWSDLISTFNKITGQAEVSVPKAQMVFWTVIILVLFVFKSVLLGALWPVPWEMVALTGVSQAGYIGDKLVQS